MFGKRITSYEWHKTCIFHKTAIIHNLWLTVWVVGVLSGRRWWWGRLEFGPFRLMCCCRPPVRREMGCLLSRYGRSRRLMVEIVLIDKLLLLTTNFCSYFAAISFAHVDKGLMSPSYVLTPVHSLLICLK